MIHLRKAHDRGHFDHGWLNTFQTFSFADYYEPDFMGFRSLRVINEDRVQPGQGFGMHGHKDMEIITCVLAGALAHKDSLGNGSMIKPGELQRGYVLFPSKEARDAAVASGMERGMAAGYDRLDELLAAVPA